MNSVSLIGKTPDSIETIRRTKAWIYPESKVNVPQEFNEKRLYMQRDEFLKDKHNQEMFSLSDKLMAVRDKIANLIEEHNSAKQKGELIQATNGFSRIKKYLDVNKKLDFADSIGLTTADAEYKIAKSKLYNKSREFLKNIGK